MRLPSLVLALIVVGGSATACTLERGTAEVDLLLSVVNRSPSTAVVSVIGPARYTLSVHSCSGQGVGLTVGDHTISVEAGGQNKSLGLHVPLQADRAARRVIVIGADGSVDADSTADPNATPC